MTVDRRFGDSTRSPFRRGLDIAVVLMGLSLAWGAFMDALSNVAARSAPDLVLRLMPYDPEARVIKAAKLADRLADPTVRLKIDDWVHGSLAYDIVNPLAIQLLGFIADADGKHSQAYRLNSLAQRLSRRELGAQLWFIQYEVQRGDVAAALDHYDIALTTVGDSRSLLFSVLGQAIGEPVVRQAFEKIYERNAEWVPSFLTYAMTDGHNPAAVADIVLASAHRPVANGYREFEPRLMQSLADANDFDRARAVAARIPGFSAAEIASVAFRGLSVDPRFGPFSWRLLTGADYGAEWTDDRADARRLKLQALPGANGVAARKLLLPHAGPYLFRVDSDLDNQDESTGGGIGFSLECLAASGSTVVWTTAPASPRQIAERINVPATCGAAYLNVNVAGGDSRSGMLASVKNIELQPAVQSQ